jgi:glycine C-acetyltransferase
MLGAFQTHLTDQLNEIRSQGLYKTERAISTPQRAHIRTADGKEVLNFCGNNYLGLADHPEVIEAAKGALERWGFGLASVRFICGTQEIHKDPISSNRRGNSLRQLFRCEWRVV